MKNICGVQNVYNYYGMVEQTGSIFIESKKCEYLHTSIFSDILIRDEKFNLVKNGQKGLIQLLSLLPTSYPGHNILTEDIGEIVQLLSSYESSWMTGNIIRLDGGEDINN